MASLVSDDDSIQSAVRHHSVQLLDIISQLRSMIEEIKKIQFDRYNDWMEHNNDKEELKSLIISLRSGIGSRAESVHRTMYSPSFATDSVHTPHPEGGVEKSCEYIIHLSYPRHHHRHLLPSRSSQLVLVLTEPSLTNNKPADSGYVPKPKFEFLILYGKNIKVWTWSKCWIITTSNLNRGLRWLRCTWKNLPFNGTGGFFVLRDHLFCGRNLKQVLWPCMLNKLYQITRVCFLN